MSVEDLKAYDYAIEYESEHLVASPVLDKGGIRLVDVMGSDLSVVNAARASYGKESTEMTDRDKGLINFLAKGDHISPFRHAFMTFEFKAPLEVARQHWKYVVGSDHCQPTGTLVTRVTGKSGDDNRSYTCEQAQIEDIRVGDYVQAFKYQGSAHFYKAGKQVTAVKSRMVNEDIFVVTADKKTSRYTGEHPCVIKIGDAFHGKYVVYLMQKGNSYRIGVTQGYRGTALGMRVRFTREDCDSMWALDTHDDLDSALIQESILSYQSGIPMMLFKATDKYSRQDFVDRFWDNMGDLSERAQALLGSFGKHINEPLFTKENFSNSLKTQTTIVTAACNLVDGMLVCAPREGIKGYEADIWHPITVSQEYYAGKVYSLTVADVHTYVADGIVTHNCMDSWNEMSGRYVTKIDEFYIPKQNQWRSAPEDSKQGSGGPVDEELGYALTTSLIEYCDRGESLYQDAIAAGVAPEMARLFLPAYGIYTYYRWSASLQSVLHFLSQRLASDAQHEITEYAKVVYDMVKTRFPVSTEAWMKK